MLAELLPYDFKRSSVLFSTVSNFKCKNKSSMFDASSVGMSAIYKSKNLDFAPDTTYLFSSNSLFSVILFAIISFAFNLSTVCSFILKSLLVFG